MLYSLIYNNALDKGEARGEGSHVLILLCFPTLNEREKLGRK